MKKNTNVIRSVANRTTALPQRSEFTRTNRLRHRPISTGSGPLSVDGFWATCYRVSKPQYSLHNEKQDTLLRRTKSYVEACRATYSSLDSVYKNMALLTMGGGGRARGYKRGVYHWLKLSIYDRTGCLAIRNSFLDVHHFVYGLCGNVSSCVVTHQRLLRWPRDRCLYEPAKVTL